MPGLAWQGSDKLIRDFERWYRSDWAKKPERATFVLNRLRERGGYEDGRRVVRVLLKSVKGRVAVRIRDGLARALRTRATKPGVRSAILEALIQKSRVVRRKGAEVRLHKRPDIVRRLLPLVAVYEPVKHLAIIQSFARNDDPAIYMAAAEAVRVADHAHGLSVLLGVIEREEDTRRLRTLSRWFVELWSRRARQLPKAQRDEVAARLEAHLCGLPIREAIDLEHKHLLMPALLQIRAKSSIPALIDELETAYRRWRRPGRHAVPIGVCRWMHSVRDALVDLSGFSAGVGQVASWKDFWRREQKSLKVRPKPSLHAYDRARRLFWRAAAWSTRCLCHRFVDEHAAAPSGSAEAAAHRSGTRRSAQGAGDTRRRVQLPCRALQRGCRTLSVERLRLGDAVSAAATRHVVQERTGRRADQPARSAAVRPRGFGLHQAHRAATLGR